MRAVFGRLQHAQIPVLLLLKVLFPSIDLRRSYFQYHADRLHCLCCEIILEKNQIDKNDTVLQIWNNLFWHNGVGMTTMLAHDSLDPDCRPCHKIVRIKEVASPVVPITDTVPFPMAIVAFQCKNIEILTVSLIQFGPVCRLFRVCIRKDIAMMRIYRYHVVDVLRR